MKKPIRFSIITPCKNAEDLIGETVDSICSQTAVRSGRVELEYLVCDGASTDATVDTIQKRSRGTATIISEPDSGMYDALARGLAKCTGDVIAYLNAGDMYSPWAFDVVADVLSGGHAKWITGLTGIFNARGQLTYCRFPYRYRSSLINCGMYGSRLPHIQQESTFWTRSLTGELDLERLASFQYAGDAFLWFTFAQHERLMIVESLLGGFRVHPGQLSEQGDAYRTELRSVSKQPSTADKAMTFLDRLVVSAPRGIKVRMSRQSYLIFDHKRQAWLQ